MDSEKTKRWEDIAAGRDQILKYGARSWEFKAFADGYEFALKEIGRIIGVKPRKIFVGACGNGADVLAAYKVWPEAEISAVSILDLPLPEVRNAIGDQLRIFEMTMLEYIEKARKDLKLRNFDLVMVFNTLTREICEQTYMEDFHKGLHLLLSKGAYVAHTTMAHMGNRMDIEYMDSHFGRISLSRMLTIDDYYLWKSND